MPCEKLGIRNLFPKYPRGDNLALVSHLWKAYAALILAPGASVQKQQGPVRLRLNETITYFYLFVNRFSKLFFSLER